ncbi:GNAT family N-acetyltransferase [Vibrio aestuarianus]|uniref:tRNA(Met) cytidine acetyltransferase TmcA n=1 Tax=Vibrio aestuarianus TaxID=28171 RepID=A0ABN8TLJ7_9VIBR|nr:GNAT family N-acetyltransferase [Vibrio aestuarianus]MDE1229759.1 GNAT family N-acetyltransferase [Vibrio aestuarianus]MDE1258370.1 GNAT family N-acetyltransferase [Vibrio aestuarianus]MDE1270635.1 GNAT family N-acetyltransferase [Vibrio aestuarianus]MDE1292200.1 GNAT family N-acetyltransferase [Vibrio aestuarianus]MDE1307264.1 GNAT family N-acetyltransferase [Vibrio aestuarianus]
MKAINDYLKQLIELANLTDWRFGVVVRGDDLFQNQVCDTLLTTGNPTTCFQVGGAARDVTRSVPFNKGQQLLGQECQRLIYDLSDGFDANSFSAALGALKGAGILLVMGNEINRHSPAQQWLNMAFEQLLVLEQSRPLPVLPNTSLVTDELPLPLFSQQKEAIAGIVHVVEGHRKRPLVITADRGRGKSSALGSAAAELMKKRNINILITAPTINAVKPIFEHAALNLAGSSRSTTALRYQHSSLQFVAPDELLRLKPQGDLLLVDEAAALPLALLQQMVELYHRAVFSTTIHGYEGCGRGFTLKFQSWLNKHRPGVKSFHIDQPIRWKEGDPLEQWQYQTFLLNYDLPTLAIPSSFSLSHVTLELIPKQQMLNEPRLLHEVFSLLVNAHYQTSPNDLFHLLADDNMQLYVSMLGKRCLGCILTVDEGQLDEPLIRSIQQGQRRPKGHLVPISLANQVGIAEAASQSCTRIMRIAVHPDWQRKGVGAQLLTLLSKKVTSDYLATSFGATSELIHFWSSQHFVPVKIGTQRDQASGCYSLLMVQDSSLSWIAIATQRFKRHFLYSLMDTLQNIEPELVRTLLMQMANNSEVFNSDPVEMVPYRLLSDYSAGGSDFESVSVWIQQELHCLNSEFAFSISDVLVKKCLQNKSWSACANELGLSGRKQIEQAIRHDLSFILDNLHCKTAESD